MRSLPLTCWDMVSVRRLTPKKHTHLLASCKTRYKFLTPISLGTKNVSSLLMDMGKFIAFWVQAYFNKIFSNSCSFGAAVTRYRPQSVAQLVMVSGGGPTPLAPPGGVYSFPRYLLGCAKPLLMCGFRRYGIRNNLCKFGIN